MAFFGLTHLGSASPFRRSAVCLRTVRDFTDDEFAHAFVSAAASQSMSKQAASRARLAQQLASPCEPALPVDEARMVLASLYEGEPAQAEIAEMHRHIKSCATEQKETMVSVHSIEFMTLSQFLQAVRRTRDATETAQWGTSSITTTSSTELQEALHRHRRSALGPSDLVRAPLTTSHQYGFYAASENDRVARHERSSCEETKYASALVRSGLY